MVTKIAVILVGVIAFVGGSASAIPAVVDYVLDGDTFAAHVIVENNIRISARVRLADVDTTEIHGQWDDEIKMKLRARAEIQDL